MCCFVWPAGIMDHSDKPDYNACVSIVTRAALREMVKPALLALGAPVVVGFVFRWIGEVTDRSMLGVEVRRPRFGFGLCLVLVSLSASAACRWWLVSCCSVR